MSTHDDGGPAFPVPPGAATFTGDPRDGAGYEPSQAGMSLRDFFAGMALQGMMANEIATKVMCDCGSPDDAAALIATACYDFSDAMLAARKEVQP